LVSGKGTPAAADGSASAFTDDTPREGTLAGNPLVIYLDSPAQLYKLEESDWFKE